MIKKTKVINILYHVPPYDNYPIDKPPPVNWVLPNGKWIGIWGYDIPNKFGEEILKRSQNLVYEVWQPDLRANKIYSHTFSSGVVHKLFPAKAIHRMKGLKIVEDVFSQVLIDELKRTIDDMTVIHLNSISGSINERIINEFYSIPKVVNFHSKITSLPIQQIFKLRKNIFYNFQNIIKHFNLKKNRKIIFTYNNSKNIKYFTKYPNLGIYRIFTSIDFKYWVRGDKKRAKASFNIKEFTFVFSMASRLNPHKQIDKIINIFSNLENENEFDFCLLIAGNGEDSYINYLHTIAEKLINKGKIKFTGYLTGDKLKTLYNASDMFISASISEGGPTSVIKAMACEVPVFCTKSGGVDDFIEEHGGGNLLEWDDYSEWESVFKQILLKQNKPKNFNRELSKKLFNWDIAAKKYIEIYRHLIDKNK